MINYSHEHAEWIASGNLMDRILIHITELKLWHFPICLRREAMHLQCFRPRTHGIVTTFADFGQLIKV